MMVACAQHTTHLGVHRILKPAFQRQRLSPPLITHFLRREGFTPLHEAARHGDLRVVQLLVGEGADVNAVALE